MAKSDHRWTPTLTNVFSGILGAFLGVVFRMTGTRVLVRPGPIWHRFEKRECS